MEQDKWIAVLEARVKAFDKVAEESSRTVQRLDSMEGQVHRFTGALESFLGRIRIDDTFRLVPERRHLTPAPAAGPSHTRSASPSPLLEFPMDEDPDSGVPSSSVANTRTTPSDVKVGLTLTPISESAAVPVAVREPAPASSSADPLHPPTVTLIPATPQGSQKLTGPTLIASVVHRTSPPLTAVAEAPPPPHPVPRGRSRMPAIDPSRLGIREGPTTRARSRSKTPI